MTVVGTEAPKTAEVTNEHKVEQKEDGMFDSIDKTNTIPDQSGAPDVAASSILPGKTKDSIEERAYINNESFSSDELTITPAEKTAFIDAMLTGDRYRQKMSLFGGRISLTLRSRTADETHSFYAYIKHQLAEDSESMSMLEGEMAYVPIVAQVEELNGVKYGEMKLPLTYEMQDGKLVEPGWLADFKAWKKRPEGLTSAIINRIQLFEYKYWTMVKEAANKNFWNSDTSIAE